MIKGASGGTSSGGGGVCRLLALVLVAALVSVFCVRATAQEKPHSTSWKDDKGDFYTKNTWEEEGKQHVEFIHRNAKGKLLEKRTDVTGSEGTSIEQYEYNPDGSEEVLHHRKQERDNTGKVTREQYEDYANGVMADGFVMVLRPGDSHLTTVQKWNDKAQRYDDVPAEQQEKERRLWRRRDEKQAENAERWRELRERLKKGGVKLQLHGNGNTIGRIGDARIQNETNQPATVYLPATVLESKNGSQDYVMAHDEEVPLGPGETKTIPIEGACLERNEPPAGPKTGDLVLDDPDQPSTDSHFSPPEVVALTDIARSIYEAVDQLQKDGVFDKFPYSDKQEQDNIATQWATWSDPRISDITHSPPAHKDDFKKVVNDQVSKHHKPDKDTRKKIDQGIDNMWDGIELTSKKAKDLDESDKPNDEETPPPLPPSTYNVDNNTPTPAPQTKEKPKNTPKDGGSTREKPKESPKEGGGTPMTTTRLLVNVLKGVDANDDTHKSKDTIKKDLKKAVDEANKLLSKCGVQLELKDGDMVFGAPNPDDPKSENMDGNYDADKATDINKKAGEELKKAHGSSTSGLKIYVVDEITNKKGTEQGVGYWFPKEGSTETDPGFVLVEAGVADNGQLLAHEIGHALGGLDDEAGKTGNLMNPAPGRSDAKNLSDEQCQKLRDGANKRK